MRTLSRALAGFGLGLLVLAAWASGGYVTSKPGPQGVVLIRRPTIQWPFVPTGGLRVTACSMKLNGERVAAGYSEAAGAIQYTPSEPMRGGTYSVACEIELDRTYRLQQKWSFAVSESALAALPGPTAEQKDGLAAVNALRRMLGVGAAYLESSLCAASLSHAEFMNANKTVGHFEKPDLPGFAGEKPIDRAQAFGWAGGVWENVAMCRATPAEFVAGLFDAPYHRLPFMQPGRVALGVGFDGRFACMDFASAPAEGLVVSPAAGQEDVPTFWDGNEHPSPLAVHGQEGPVGYPLVFACFSPENERISFEKGALRGPDGDVPILVNHPGNDPHLTNAVVIVPKSPLHPRTPYEASVEARTAGGRVVRKVWRFTTGG